MYEQRMDDPQVDEDDRQGPPRRERNEWFTTTETVAMRIPVNWAQPARRNAESGREPDDAADQGIHPQVPALVVIQ